MKLTHFAPRPAHRQHGVVLIVALVMLIVISLASVAIMKGAINTDNVADNNRRQSQAMQAAQAALRYCENKVLDKTLVPLDAVSNPAQENWKTYSNWQSSSNKLTVPADFLSTPGTTTPTVVHAPECMAQYRALGSDQVVVVTARGFSDNYVESNGRTEAGAVVWLQSVLQLAAAATP